jgi:hypothetical protein
VRPPRLGGADGNASVCRLEQRASPCQPPSSSLSPTTFAAAVRHLMRRVKDCGASSGEPPAKNPAQFSITLRRKQTASLAMNVASALAVFPGPDGAGPQRPTPVWQWPRARAHGVAPDTNALARPSFATHRKAKAAAGRGSPTVGTCNRHRRTVHDASRSLPPTARSVGQQAPYEFVTAIMPSIRLDNTAPLALHGLAIGRRSGSASMVQSARRRPTRAHRPASVRLPSYRGPWPRCGLSPPAAHLQWSRTSRQALFPAPVDARTAPAGRHKTASAPGDAAAQTPASRLRAEGQTPGFAVV